MDIKYARYNRQRNEQFQTETAIGYRFDQLTVRKRALNDKATRHVQRIQENYELLQLHFSTIKTMKLVPVTLENNAVFYEYISEKTLNEMILDYIRNKKFEEFYAVLDQYVSFLNSLNVLQVDKAPVSDEFKQVFGTECDTISGTVFPVGNIDLTFENLFLINGQYQVIDYEWVFDFHIPVKYVLYRAIQQLVVRIRDYMEIDYNDLLSRVGISVDEYGQYAQMERSFVAYVKSSNYLGQYLIKDNASLEDTKLDSQWRNVQPATSDSGLIQKGYLELAMQQYSSEKNIYIWGTGTAGIKTMAVLNDLGYKVSGFLDNNEKKWGTVMQELPISSLEQVSLESDYIVIGSSYFKEIKKQLDEAGLKQHIHYCFGIIN
ncbi:hypothetical protein [Paenibacillus sp. FSL H8-0537]|uniref:nucleoside-diphosphate sugar epimerase/dehydratase n=1 Tax=Paenibacillus sp. FSL H8-0537 TaxID=2921399 RepID=UPI003101227E